jgi:hypothetical protein
MATNVLRNFLRPNRDHRKTALREIATISRTVPKVNYPIYASDP